MNCRWKTFKIAIGSGFIITCVIGWVGLSNHRVQESSVDGTTAVREGVEFDYTEKEADSPDGVARNLDPPKTESSAGGNAVDRGAVAQPNLIENAHMIEGLCTGFGYSESDEVRSLQRMLALMKDGYGKSTPLSDRIIELWNAKDYSAVAKIADERIAGNDTDLVGHILRMELAMLNVDLQSYYHHSERVLRLMTRVDTERFTELKPILVVQFKKAVQALALQSPDDISKYRNRLRHQRENRDAPGRLLSTEFHIRALELDGAMKSAASN